MSGVVRWAVKTMLKRRDRLTARPCFVSGKKRAGNVVFLSLLKTLFYNASHPQTPFICKNIHTLQGGGYFCAGGNTVVSVKYRSSCS